MVVTMRKIKSKNLFQMSNETVTTRILLQFNEVTEHIGVYTGFFNKAYRRIYFKPLHTVVKSSLPKPGKGNNYHHIAYHFDDPDKGAVLISTKLHTRIHNSLGNGRGFYID